MKMLFLSLLFLSCSCQNIIIDSSMSAISSNDYTAIIQGCGNQPIVGYTYCRKTAGDAAYDYIVLIAPKTKCKTKPCAEYKFYNPDGQPIFGGSFEDETSIAKVMWNKIIDKDTFDVNDFGFIPVMYKIKYLNNDGFEGAFFVQGEIRLRVLPKGYESLNNVENDANFVFFNEYEGYLIKMTTSGRATVYKNGASKW